jgi:hypothetical protein
MFFNDDEVGVSSIDEVMSDFEAAEMPRKVRRMVLDAVELRRAAVRSAEAARRLEVARAADRLFDEAIDMLGDTVVGDVVCELDVVTQVPRYRSRRRATW